MLEQGFEKVTHDNGLVCAYYINEQIAEPLGWKEVNQWQPSDGSMWIHLDINDSNSEKWLRKNSGIEPMIIDSLLRNDTRPRFSEMDEEQILLIIRGINFHKGDELENMLSIRIWTDGERIISVRRKPLLSVVELRNVLEKKNNIRSVEQLILFLLRQIDSKIEPVIYQLSQELDKVEENIEAGNTSEKIKLAEILDESSVFLRHLTPQKDVLARMRESNISWLKGLRNNWRELFHAMVIYIDELVEVKERVKVQQDMETQRILEQTNKTMYLLSIVAAIFLPLTLFTGILGINVGGIPGTENPYAFTIVCGLTIGMGIIAVYYFKWKKLL